jgi:polyisoprenoid-binding protein YceI
MRIKSGLAAAAVASVLAVASAKAEGPSAWRVTRGDVRVICPLTVGGSFDARTSAVRGTLTLTTPSPAALAGELAVDLKTLDTGIGLRDEHMREQYLETGKGEGFDTAVLSEIRLPEAGPGFSGRTRFTGTLLLHGTRHPVSGQAEIRREAGGAVRVDASFPVVLADYGIATPRYLGVGVKDEVQVRTSMTASPGGVAAVDR